jgi:type IV pilus assembly protein PilA
MKNNKGMTLIEAIIVLVILGLIAAIVLPAIEKNRASRLEKLEPRRIYIIKGETREIFIESTLSGDATISKNKVVWTDIEGRRHEQMLNQHLSVYFSMNPPSGK